MSSTEENKDPFDSLLEKLENEKWPNSYMFKFILPGSNPEKMRLVKDEFGTKKVEMSVNKSKNGKYISLSVKVKKMYSAQAVIDIYRNVSKIEGVMAL